MEVYVSIWLLFAIFMSGAVVGMLLNKPGRERVL